MTFGKFVAGALTLTIPAMAVAATLSVVRTFGTTRGVD
jgi:hypothetical protein